MPLSAGICCRLEYLPLTTVITVVRFGTRERLVIQRKGLQFPEHEPIAALPDYVTSRAEDRATLALEYFVIQIFAIASLQWFAFN